MGQDTFSETRDTKLPLSRPPNLLPNAGILVGEAAEAPLTEETQLESVGRGCLLRHKHTNRMSKFLFFPPQWK